MWRAVSLLFWFSGFRAAVVEVTALNPDDLVRWRVVAGGARDWIGTEIEFKIFLLSLKGFVETGKGRPHPYETPVNMWRPPKEVAA